jgi:hypothetical protein
MLNRNRVALAIATALLATMTVALSAQADPAGACPDNHIPLLATTVTNGEKQDKNGNLIVCGKLGPDGKFHGGPDDNPVLVDDVV